MQSEHIIITSAFDYLSNSSKLRNSPSYERHAQKSQDQECEIQAQDTQATIHSNDTSQCSRFYSPFASLAFFQALESSGSTSAETGWQPWHVQVTDEQNQPHFLPGYMKHHSYGEYVFDWNIARAVNQAGIPYYPKWVMQLPFTPIALPFEEYKITVNDIHQLNTQLKPDSPITNQFLYVPDSWQTAFIESGALMRSSIFFRWHNQGYSVLTDYLSQLTQKRAKEIRRERRKAQAHNTQISRFSGEAISDAIIKRFYPFYRRTYLKRSGHSGYLNEAFFLDWLNRVKQSALIVLAQRDQQDIAAALFLFDDSTLYGRYWGCRGDDRDSSYGQLHFECCYYQGMEFCIEQKLRFFNPGVQGEHKVVRGFEPYLAQSAYFYHHPQLHQQVGDYLVDENRQTRHYLNYLQQKLPFKPRAKAEKEA